MKAKKALAKSVLEIRFLWCWNTLAPKTLPRPHEEVEFSPTRQWRFDFAWPEQRLAVEVEGGIWTGGRHTRGKGFQEDARKYNAATLLGWRVLRFTADDLEKRPVQVIEEVSTALTGKPDTITAIET